nr:NAD-dependent epimerase/dehydratase family protein [uncultured Desulfobacter sp.]
MKIFVTGSSGFVGSQLLLKLASLYDSSVYGVVRKNDFPVPQSVEKIEIQSLNDIGLFRNLGELDAVIHLAGKTSSGKIVSSAEKEEMKAVNVGGTLNLARQAAEHGVKRFVFLSTVKVNGGQTQKGQPFVEINLPQPEDAYGRSKLEAEEGLNEISLKTGLEVVVIRSPLVYGPGVKGNFVSLMRLVEIGFPFPLGGIDNKRSLVGLQNLIDFIVTCVEHPAAANQTFFVSDGNDLSTSELLKLVAKAMGRPSRMFSVSSHFLKVVGKLFGKKAISQRLFGSLQVDINKARCLLGWRPKVSVEKELARCIKKNVKEKGV